MRDFLMRTAGSGRLAIAGLALIIIFIAAMKRPLSDQPHTYLALGDSYTIGEKVPAAESFPAQTIDLLRGDGHTFKDPAIIAETGWTSGDLMSAIAKSKLAARYDFVTLLIGVNNQYQNLELPKFVTDFETLLNKAIQLAGKDASHVFVLSIPDWSVTPFAITTLPDRFGRQAEHITKQIDEFNAACKLIAAKHHVTFIDITPDTRKAAEDPNLIASDGLHPSAKEYSVWAEKVARMIKRKL